ncbi:Oxysterol-binding protein, partial [Hyaloraphidium curvatum]
MASSDANGDSSMPANGNGGSAAAAPVSAYGHGGAPEAAFAPRRALPAKGSADAPGSSMTLLKRSLGKDLGKISMPVTVAEPLSLLQKLAEQFDYCELLERAASISGSPHSRALYVAAFAVSSLSSQARRTSRKPFNPLLGETYELIRKDRKLRFLAEKTVHHPTTVAWHAECTDLVHSVFKGTFVEVLQKGSPVHVTLRGIPDKEPGFEERYIYLPPDARVVNIMAGTRTLEYVGALEVLNLATRDVVVVEFREGASNGQKRTFSGAVKNSKYVDIVGIEGTWDRAMSLVDPSKKNPPRTVWRARDFPPDSAENWYGFSTFAMQLNEITPDMVGRLPRTDSRLRPDQRLLEEGRVDDAEKEKQRLETLQRERRKAMEARGEAWRPRWFSRRQDTYRHIFEEGKEKPGALPMSWQYDGGYWEAR